MDIAKLSGQQLVAAALDTGLFWGSNEIAALMGVRRVKTNVSDNVVYAIVDVINRAGMFGIQGFIPMISTKLGAPESKIREYLKFRQPQFVAVLIALLLKEGLYKGKFKFVTPLMKATIGFFGNIAGDMVLSPELM